MLAFTRRKEQDVTITVGGVRVTVRVGAIRGSKVQLLFDAPAEVMVNRGEVQAELDAIAAGRVVAAQ